ncbi:Uncharacterised protein [Candidatus Tiddalikarchaeum anstoanum]|nr:Uncharacterised protein [Candidatus Tiddalikarchaeum anstoanum]
MVTEIRSITRIQLNPKPFLVNIKELADKIHELMQNLNYDTDEESHKFEQGATPEEVKDLEIRISGYKAIDNYSKFKIETSIVMVRGKKEKIKVGNKTKDVFRGDGKITILPVLILDYDNKWEKDPYLHFLKNIYERFLYFSTRKALAAKLFAEATSVKDDIKDFLNME